MSRIRNVGVAGGIIWLVLVVGMIVGWFMNIFDMIGMAQADAPINVEFVLRIVGVFVPPLGAIMGIFV